MKGYNMAEKKIEKTNTQRVEELYKMCEEHFGDVRFVGLKYHTKVGWVAKVNFEAEFENLTAYGDDATDALKQLKQRVKKIIKRYNRV